MKASISKNVQFFGSKKQRRSETIIMRSFHLKNISKNGKSSEAVTVTLEIGCGGVWKPPSLTFNAFTLCLPYVCFSTLCLPYVCSHFLPPKLHLSCLHNKLRYSSCEYMMYLYLPESGCNGLKGWKFVTTTAIVVTTGKSKIVHATDAPDLQRNIWKRQI